MDKIVRTIKTKGFSGSIDIRKDKDGNEYGWVPEHELEFVEEQTFFNNGQFNEDELDLINWGLNDLLEKINKGQRKPAKGLVFAKTEWRGMPTTQQIENLIEKIQEGS